MYALTGYMSAVNYYINALMGYITAVIGYNRALIGNTYLFQVAKHKTAESGPAVLAVNPKLYGYLRLYLDMLRIIPGYNLDDERSIFTSWPKTDGTVALMTSSHVNKAINRIWELGPVVKSISATRLRKATSTAVRTAIPNSREVLARHMTHNPETADRHYALYNQRELAVPVTNMISAVMEGKKPAKSTANIMKSIHWLKENETDNITQDSTQKFDNITQDWRQKGDNITVSTKKCHGRRSFEGHEAEKLIEICDEVIWKGAITKNAVIEKVTGSEEGRIIFLQLQTRIGRYKDVWKVITDRLQTEKKKRRKVKL